MTGTWDTPDCPPEPWVAVADHDMPDLHAAGWHVPLLAGLRTRVAEDTHAALVDVPGITWTFEPET